MSFDLSPVRVAHLLQPHADKLRDYLKNQPGVPDDNLVSADAVADLNHMLSTLDDSEAVLRLTGPIGFPGPAGMAGRPGRDGLPGTTLRSEVASKLKDILKIVEQDAPRGVAASRPTSRVPF